MELTSKTGHSIRFRPETQNDLEGIWSLYSTLSNESKLSLPPIDRQLVERWSENLPKYMIPSILATVEIEPDLERIIGRSVLECRDKPQRRHRAEFGITVHDDYQNQGIGTALTQHMLDIAKTYGLMKVTLSVFSDNKKAISIYEKCGFIREGLLKNPYFYHDRFYDIVLMSKQLKDLTIV